MIVGMFGYRISGQAKIVDYPAGCHEQGFVCRRSLRIRKWVDRTVPVLKRGQEIPAQRGVPEQSGRQVADGPDDAVHEVDWARIAPRPTIPQPGNCWNHTRKCSQGHRSSCDSREARQAHQKGSPGRPENELHPMVAGGHANAHQVVGARRWGCPAVDGCPPIGDPSAR